MTDQTMAPSAPPRAAGRGAALVLPAVFTANVFLSAALLFFVQPLFTRLALPEIGGAPAVWTTAMLFFQTVLIAGYVYAHLSSRYLPPAAQVGLHLVLWAAALTTLPLRIPADWRFDPAFPAEWQALTLYALGVGLPFAVLSATAPLLQKWYARSGGRSSGDPYFLYAASNAGSLVSLLAFPLVAEPLFGVSAISFGWSAGFAALGALLLASGVLAGRGNGSAAPDRGAAVAEGLRVRTLGCWALLGFVPSSLMLAATTKISTDLGSLPLVWVVPLALYLLSFVLAFSGGRFLDAAGLRVLMLAGLVPLVAISCDIVTLTRAGAVSLLLGFFAVAVVAHRLLYLGRPDPRHLTVFYITMSVGGAAGGLFNSIAAPRLFNDLSELPLTVAIATALLFVLKVPGDHAPGRAVRDLSLGIGLAAVAAAPVALTSQAGEGSGRYLLALALAGIVAAGLAILRARPLAVVVGTAALLATTQVASWDEAVFRDRSFFGTHKVMERDGIRYYVNGSTVHGAQRLDGKARPDPLTYYTPEGPMGRALSGPIADNARIGVVGLGVGALACYSRPGQTWDFYEIDPAVDALARDPARFGFMSACAGNSPTHLGDARIVLSRDPDRTFDILVIDAYSSDSVPVHLTTLEAVNLYRSRLRPGGVILFHVSNRFYRIDLPLARAANALGIHAAIARYGIGAVMPPGVSPSVVVAMAETPEALARLTDAGGWEPLTADGGRVWTDDYANPMSILN